jgi:hypothetical protein
LPTAAVIIHPVPTLGVIAQAGGAVCAGSAAPINLSGLLPNTNLSISYSIDGVPQTPITGTSNGSGALSFNTPPLLASNNGRPITVTSITSIATGCSQTFSISANLTVNPLLTPEVSITANPNGAICAGTPVTFTAAAINGGIGAGYQWKVNGNNVGTNSTTYTTNALVNGDIVSVVLTSAEVCVSQATATSNAIAMTVNPNLVVNVSASASTTTICAGGQVNFTATPTNGGITPTYQWQVNGVNVGPNSATPTFSSTTLADGDQVRVVLTSSEACTVDDIVESAPIAISVNPNLPVSVSISASSSNICVGGSATFTAVPTNGGPISSYQWQINGTDVGSNSPTFTTNSLVNGQVVTVLLTSNATCATGSPATSNAIPMTVHPNLPVSVSINASATTICAGTNVTFTATPTNGGSTPVYQWKINGVNAGTNSATFTTNALTNGQTVTVELTSNEGCTTGNPATSNSIAVAVNPNLPVGVTIGASQTTICAGSSVTFTATPVNGGTTPAYQWQVNGANVGTNSASFTSSTLSDGQVVTVILTSNATCATGSPATSNAIGMTVNPLLPASVSISASATTVCAGSNVTFTATPANGGSTPAYQWKLNGANVGTNSATYSNSSLVNSDKVTVVMTSNATCATGSPATGNEITMTVNPVLTPSVSISTPATSICSTSGNTTFTATPVNGGAAPTYQWRINGLNLGTPTTLATFTRSNNTLNNGDIISVVMTSNATCIAPATATSNGITMAVSAQAPGFAGGPNGRPGSSSLSVCPPANIVLTAGNPANNSGAPVSYTWSLPANWVITSGDGTNRVNVSILGGAAFGNNISYSVTAINGCGTATNSNTLNINSFAAVEAGNPVSVCTGAGAQLDATFLGNTAAVTWTIVSPANSGTFDNNILEDPIFTPSIASGVITLRATTNDPAGTCPPANDIVQVFVNRPPVITLQPAANTLCTGQNVTFTASATGDSLKYQWRKDGVDIPGAINSSYSKAGLTLSDAGNYTVFVSGGSTCTPVLSQVAALVVNQTVTISQQPQATQTVCSGNQVNFSVTASHPGFNYQWKRNGVNLINGSGISGVNTTNLTINPVAPGDAGTYTVEISGAGICATVNSANAVLVVNEAITITGQPDNNQVVCNGGNVSFTVAASGTNLTYQWRRDGVNLNNGGVVSGATSATLTLSGAAIADAGDYTVVISGASPCTPVTSQVAKLVVNRVVTISSQPQNVTACAGGSAAFTVTASHPGFEYQWRRGTTNLTNGGNISGANTSTLTINPASLADAGNDYNVVLNGTGICNVVTSNSVALVVNEPVVIQTQPQPTTTTCTGQNVTLSVEATGTNLTYQWRRNGVNLSNGGRFSGVNTKDLTITGAALGDGGNYTVVISGAAPCTPVTSNIGVLVVNQLVTITTQPAATQTICTGGSVSFNVVVSHPGFNYQWKKGGVSLTNGGNVSGANSATLTINPVDLGDASSDYTVEISGANICSTVVSNAAALIVNEAVNITVQPQPQVICSGTNATFSVTTTGAVTSYQWRKGNVNLTDGAGISGANTATLNLSNVAVGDAGNYNVVITAAGICPLVVSNNALLTVNAAVSIGTQPTNQVVCASQPAQFSVVANGNITGYQWFKLQGGVPVAIPGATQATYAIASALPANSGTYFVEVYGIAPCAKAVSQQVTFVVNEQINITQQPAAVAVCEGEDVVLNVTATSPGISVLNYQWYKKNPSLPDAPVGTNSNSFTIPAAAVANSGQYYAVITGPVGFTCGNISTQLTTVIVNPIPTATLTATANTNCNTSGVKVVLTGSGGTRPYTFTYTENGTQKTRTTTGAFDTAVIDLGAYIPGNYAFELNAVSDNAPGKNCGRNISGQQANIVIKAIPVLTVTPAATSICSGTSTNIVLTSNLDPNTTFSWTVSANGVNGATAAGGNAIAQNLTTTGNTPGTVTYTITPMLDGCAGNVETVTITVNPIPLVTTASVNPGAICSFTNVTVNLGSSVAGTRFDWVANGTNVNMPVASGSTTSSSFQHTASASGTVNGTITYTITPFANGCTGTPQTTAPVTILPLPAGNIQVNASGNITVCRDATQPMVTFTGSNGNAPYEFTYLISGQSGSFTIGTNAGQSTASLPVSTATPGTYVYSLVGVKYSNDPGCPQVVNPAITATVVVKELPTATISGNATVCIGTPSPQITFAGNGGTQPYTFQYSINGGAPVSVNSSGGNTATVNVPTSVAGTFVYSLISVREAGTPACIQPQTGTVTVIVQPDETITLKAGSSAAQNVCINYLMTPITFVTGGSANGAVIVGTLPAGVTSAYAGNELTISGTPTVPGTYNFKVQTTGPCNLDEKDVTIIVDALPIGGTAVNPSTLMACAASNGGKVGVGGYSGVISGWQASTNGGLTWTNVGGVGLDSFTYTGLSLTTWFRAVIIRPSCTGVVVYSSHAVVNVVPKSGTGSGAITGFATPSVLCSGSSTLTALGLGQEGSVGALAGGDFDNAGAPLEGEGLWRAGIDGIRRNISANANNGTNPFNLTNGPKEFFELSPAPTYNASPLDGQVNNTKFMVATGPVNSTLETPIFNLLGLTTAAITWWEAYIIGVGGSLITEISTDGGVTYTARLRPDIVGPATRGIPNGGFLFTSVSLDNYVGLSNLRVRFTYIGTISTSWGIEGMTISKGTPTNIFTWNLYEPIPLDPNNPGSHYLNTFTSNSVVVTPPVNNTNAVIPYNYSIVSQNGGCAAEITVYMNPTPIVQAVAPVNAYCPGQTLNIPLQGSVSGTIFNWTRTNATITGLPMSGSMTYNAPVSPAITGVPVNNTMAPLTDIITVTPIYTFNGVTCPGTPIQIPITVNPVPAASISGSYNCSLAEATITLTIPVTGPVSGTLQPGNLAFSGTGPRAFTFVIPQPFNATVNYALSGLSINGCATLLPDTIVTAVSSAFVGTPGVWTCASGDGDWFNPCNWADGKIPTITTDVVIPAAATCTAVINPNTSFAIAAGGIAYANDITISGNGLSMTNAGQLQLGGDWWNQRGAAGFSAGNGTVAFVGATLQTITSTTAGGENFFNLLVDKPSAGDHTNGLTLLSPVNVGGTLMLESGVVNNRGTTNLLNVTNCAANAVDGGDNTAYVNGQIRRCTNSTAVYTFPVGIPSRSAGAYRPAFVQASGSGSNNFTAEYYFGLGTVPQQGFTDILDPEVIGVVNNEQWLVRGDGCSSDASVGFEYDYTETSWSPTAPLNPCTSGCSNVGIAFKPLLDWRYTDFYDQGSGFSASRPEYRFYSSNGVLWSKFINVCGVANPYYSFAHGRAIVLPIRLLTF